MPLDTVAITGTFNFPDASWMNYARAVFVISGFDTDTEVVTPEKVTVNLTSGGGLNVNLWPNTQGLRGTVYTVFVDFYTDESYSKLVKRVDFGNIQISGPAQIQNLLNIPAPMPGFLYALFSEQQYNDVLNARDQAQASAIIATNAASSAAQSAENAEAFLDGAIWYVTDDTISVTLGFGIGVVIENPGPGPYDTITLEVA
jgi:hypothetical protein